MMHAENLSQRNPEEDTDGAEPNRSRANCSIFEFNTQRRHSLMANTMPDDGIHTMPDGAGTEPQTPHTPTPLGIGDNPGSSKSNSTTSTTREALRMLKLQSEKDRTERMFEKAVADEKI